MQQYQMYKGLQRPLVFKIFKGKFIYWAMGSIMAGIAAAGIVSATVSAIAGVVALAAVTTPLLIWTVNKQKKGIYTKKLDNAIFIIPPAHYIGNHEKTAV